MNCRDDLVNYYSQSPRYAPHVVELVRDLSRSHDFATKPVFIEKDLNMDRAFLSDAERFVGAALLQFLAHSHLDAGGYITWTEVTRYYCRFFGITAFTRLLGYATFWLSELKDFKRKKGKQFWVVRVNDETHNYLIGHKSDVSKALNELLSPLPYKIPDGSGSHNTIWNLSAEICRTWNREELLYEAALPAPEETIVFPDLWGTYEEQMLEELNQRSRYNYLGEEIGYFFGELDGLNRWRKDGFGFGRYYPNPISEDAPMEDTYENKMAWSIIHYLITILARTPAKSAVQTYVQLIEQAPANEEMKSQMLRELRAILINPIE
ncbi:hypothetical protein ACFLT8_01945 [Chloroflexota bacterium]